MSAYSSMGILGYWIRHVHIIRLQNLCLEKPTEILKVDIHTLPEASCAQSVPPKVICLVYFPMEVIVIFHSTG